MDPPIPCRRLAGEGSQIWKGAIVAPERHHLPNCKQASLLTKTPWDSVWSTSSMRVSARDLSPEETHGTPEKARRLYTQKTEQQGWGRRCHSPHLGETVLAKHLVICAAQTWEGHKTQAQPSLHLCGVPKNLNLSDLDLGSALNPGPASDSSQQSNLEPEQGRLGKHTCHERGPNPVWLKHWEHFPQTPGMFVYSVPPSPQHD